MSSDPHRLDAGALGRLARPPLDEAAMNARLAEAGYQVSTPKGWRITLKGRIHGGERWTPSPEDPALREVRTHWNPQVLQILPPAAEPTPPPRRKPPRVRPAPPGILDRWQPDGRIVAVCDTESTGPTANPTHPSCHDVVQVAFVLLDSGTLEETGSFSSWIRPVRPHNQNRFAMRVHGRTMAELRRAPAPRDVARRMEELLLGPAHALQDTPETRRFAARRLMLIGHNLPHDLRFLDLLYHAVGLPAGRLGADHLCTHRMAQRLIHAGVIRTPGNKTSLDALLETFGLPRRAGCHDALDDARLTAEILRRMVALENPLPQDS